MLTFEIPPQETATVPEEQRAQLQDLFGQLNEAIAERAEVFERYALDVYWERRKQDEAYGMAYQLCMGERLSAQRAVKRVRKGIVDYVFNTRDIGYDSTLSVLQQLGVGTFLPREKEYLEKIGLNEDTRVMVGRKVFNVVGAPRMTLMQAGESRAIPAVVYETLDPENHAKAPVQHFDRVTPEGKFMLPERGLVDAAHVRTGARAESQ